MNLEPMGREMFPPLERGGPGPAPFDKLRARCQPYLPL